MTWTALRRASAVAPLLCAGAVHAASLVPNDPGIAGGLKLWLRCADVNYDATAGIWTDSSGNGKDASVPGGNPNGYGSASFTKPELVSGQNGTLFSNAFAAIEYETAAGSGIFELLGSTDINGNTGFSNLTIIAVYKCTTYKGTARPLGVGSYAIDGVAADNYNLGCDPSIRKDNGRLGDGSYTGSNTKPPGYFIRSSRMTSANEDIDEWFTVTPAGGLEHVLHLDAGAFTTRLDEFYLGTLWTRSGSTGSDTVGSIAEVLVYNTALSDQEIEDINTWLRANVGMPVAPPPLVTNALSPAELGATNIVVGNDSGGSAATYSGHYRVSVSNVAGQTFAPTQDVYVSDVTFQLGADSEANPFGNGESLSLQLYEGTNLAPVHALGPAIARSLDGLFLLAGRYITFALPRDEADAVGLLRVGQAYTLALSSSASNGVFISRSVPPGENPAGTDAPSGQGFEAGTVTGAGQLHDTEYYVQGTAPPAPDAPSGLTANAGNRRVRLDWDDNTQQGFSHFAVNSTLLRALRACDLSNSCG